MVAWLCSMSWGDTRIVYNAIYYAGGVENVQKKVLEEYD